MLKAVAVGKQTVRVWPLGRRSALAGKTCGGYPTAARLRDA